ncbi:MAG TPA: carbamoyltransferase C-terminal domain-containing protein [Solirubrobacteraceae bacterium]|nr:carbamoyltransferase C-terminal domain-containing protein [Solirubrobacteraceae bacterium]
MAEKAFARAGLHRSDSAYARSRAADLRTRVAAGERVLLLGITPAFHNSGAALVEVTKDAGLRLLCNEEEERYSGVKLTTEYPELAVQALHERLREHDASPEEIHTCVATWDYANVVGHSLQVSFEEFPGPLVHPPEEFAPRHLLLAARAPRRVASQLGLPGHMPIVMMRHHDSHAYCSYALSPFSSSDETTMITVIDGYGDDCSVSLYVGHGGALKQVRNNGSALDSAGLIYDQIASTQGGWTSLQAAGRYMGAAAWGDCDRLTNPYYKRLRQLAYFGPDGDFRLNRRFARWQAAGQRKPYHHELTDILGAPIPLERLWKPDAVLNVDDIQHAELTRDRVDKAAALQLLFEDMIFHVVGWFILQTGSTRLVMTGGTALNCVANMRLLEHYDEEWYARYLGREDVRLRAWVPPMQGDPGTPPGAAFAFAMRAGVRQARPMRHAFYCGRGPRRDEVREACAVGGEVEVEELGDTSDAEQCEAVADRIASVVANDGVLGLFQGPAETGPRALGHRSILANPCNPHTLELLNARVKYRERIRPLAPIATLEAAQTLFELSPGVSDDDYNGYNYMVFTARARAEAFRRVPAVIHRDGTARVQICRPSDPLTHAFLLAMGRHAGVEVSVNTSLNVGSPIVQTPRQAIAALRKAKAMDGIVIVADGVAFLVRLVGPRRAEASAGAELVRAAVSSPGDGGRGACGR